MLRKTITVLMMLVLTGSLIAQQRDLIIEGSSLSVQDPDEPQNGAVYSYLWWFGDGGYKITTAEDQTTHLYHDYDFTKTNSNKYVTSLITTENYGTEGNPDLIFEPVLFSSLENTTSELPKYLDPYDLSDSIRITNFRDIVPNDTFFLIVTYGLPFGSNAQNHGLFLTIDFGEDSLSFDYINNPIWNKSFLPNSEGYQGNSGKLFRWNLYKRGNMAPGRENTVLLPFKYSGNKTSGTIQPSVRVSYREFFTNQNINYENNNYSHEMEFAASHDPNRTQVALDTTTCACGGQDQEYEVHFENTGEGQTNYVRIEMELDEAHDLNSLEITRLPSWFEDVFEGPIQGYHPFSAQDTIQNKQAFYKIDEVNNRVILEFHNIFLTGLGDTLVNDPNRRKDFISFKIKVKDEYVIGDPITAFASIIFDNNDPVVTNVAITTCPDPILVENTSTNSKGTFLGIHWKCWLLYGGILFIILLIISFWIRWKRNQ